MPRDAERSGSALCRPPNRVKLSPDPDGRAASDRGRASVCSPARESATPTMCSARKREEQARPAARGVESLIARNALALRIAANGASRIASRRLDSAQALTHARRSRSIRARDGDGAAAVRSRQFLPRERCRSSPRAISHVDRPRRDVLTFASECWGDGDRRAHGDELRRRRSTPPNVVGLASRPTSELRLSVQRWAMPGRTR